MPSSRRKSSKFLDTVKTIKTDSDITKEPPRLSSVASADAESRETNWLRETGGPGNMKRIRQWQALAGVAGLGLILGTLSGCQTWVAGMTLPSGRYLEHPPQYFPPSPPFPLPRELAYQQAIAAQVPGAVAPAPLPPPVVAPVVPVPPMAAEPGMTNPPPQ